MLRFASHLPLAIIFRAFGAAILPLLGAAILPLLGAAILPLLGAVILPLLGAAIYMFTPPRARAVTSGIQRDRVSPELSDLS